MLILEPHPELRELLGLIVANLGHEPLAYEGTAVELEEPDVVLLEPAWERGLSVARTLRAARPRLPIVYASIYPATAETQALEPVSHLLKPFGLAELGRSLELALATRGAPPAAA